MKLDSITKIERFITNSLLSSPVVPLGVNVLRLADVSDEEGIVQMTNSIIVRYTSSDVDVIRQAPLDMIRTMVFEINVAAQSYLSQSGHDFAVQLCTAIHETLVNTVPPNTGVEVIEPFHLVSERFSGLTDSSHYTYTQQWIIKVQDYYRGIAIDPCVQRGDCSRLFPIGQKSAVKPGDVLFQSKAYVPVLPPPPGVPYSPDYAGVDKEESGALVYTADPYQTFLSSTEVAEGYYLVSTGTFDESGTFLICNIKDGDGKQVRSYFAAYSGRTILQINTGVSRSTIDQEGNPLNSGQADNITTSMPRNGYGYVNQPRATLFLDPTNEDTAKVTVRFGALYPIQSDTTLTHDGTKYIRIANTPLGKAWIREEDFKILTEDEYLPRLDCDEEELEEGKITSCE